MQSLFSKGQNFCSSGKLAKLHFHYEFVAGNGYISTDTLKEILKELDSKLTDEDLDNIIEEVDEDGSGTLDFDEFMEMMAG